MKYQNDDVALVTPESIPNDPTILLNQDISVANTICQADADCGTGGTCVTVNGFKRCNCATGKSGRLCKVDTPVFTLQ